MRTRAVAAGLVIGGIAMAVAGDVGAIPPGAPQPTVITFSPDSTGNKTDPFTPAQMPQLSVDSSGGLLSIISQGGNRRLQDSVPRTTFTLSRPTNELSFLLGGDSTVVGVQVLFYYGPSPVGNVIFATNGNNAVDQRVKYRNDNLFDSFVTVASFAPVIFDDITIAPLCTWVGTMSRDVRNGTAGNDVLCGRGGNDVLAGLAGNDRILGGTGNDSISGGDDNDDLFGWYGTDTLLGGIGTDHCDGGDGGGDTANQCEARNGIP